MSCGSSKKIVQTKKPISNPIEVKKTLPVTSTKDPVIVKVDTPKEEQLEATSNIITTSSTVQDYINLFSIVAQDNMKSHGIPASITLAQGILESGAGKGRLSLEANNHFGIKCHKEWKGATISHDDDALQECFRKYDNPADSYRDHSLFLTSRPWYANLFKLEKDDYKGWAHGLKKSGYATDPKYPAKLIAIIERYELYKYDNVVLGKEPQTVSVVSTVLVTEVSQLEADYEVKKGDTFYSLSKAFGISIDELKKINNLSDNTLSIGQKLKLK